MARPSERIRHKYLFFGEAGELLHHRFRQKVLLFVLVAAFLTALHVVVIRGGHMFVGESYHWDWGVPVAVAVALLLLLALQYFAKKYSSQVIAVEPHPSYVARAVVLFLSPPEKEYGSTKYEKAHKNSHLKAKAARDFVEHFRDSSWYMPLRAIYGHCSEYSKQRLNYIVVIGSKDASGYQDAHNEALRKMGLKGDEPEAKALIQQMDPNLGRTLNGMQGSIRSAGHFSQTVKHLAGRLDCQVEVVETKALSRGSGTNWQEGVNLEDADALVKVLQDAFAWLGERRVRRRDIVVDITGGNKLCAAIGAAVSLDERSRLEYMSPANFELCVYDLEYVHPDHH